MKVLFDLGRNRTGIVMNSQETGNEPVRRASRVVCGWIRWGRNMGAN